MWYFRSKREVAAAVLLGAFCFPVWPAEPIQFRTTELPWAAIGAEYQTTIQTQVDGRCPGGGIAVTVVEGSLPRGLSLQGDSLAGVPRELGLFSFRVRGANECASAEQELQLLVTGKPILRVTPEELQFEYRSGDSAPKPQSLLVSGTWPDFPYSLSSPERWLRVRVSTGVTPSAGSPFAADAVTVQILPKDLTPGLYETTLVASGYQVAIAPAISVTLRVLPPAPPQ